MILENRLVPNHNNILQTVKRVHKSWEVLCIIKSAWLQFLMLEGIFGGSQQTTEHCDDRSFPRAAPVGHTLDGRSGPSVPVPHRTRRVLQLPVVCYLIFTLLVPGKCESMFKYVIFKHFLRVKTTTVPVQLPSAQLNANGHHWWQVDIDSSDGLVPSGSKPITWIKVDPDICRHVASPGPNALNNFALFMRVSFEIRCLENGENNFKRDKKSLFDQGNCIWSMMWRVFLCRTGHFLSNFELPFRTIYIV